MLPQLIGYNHDLQGWRRIFHPPLANRLGKFTGHPRHIENETPSKTIAPLWKNPQDGVFKWELCLTLLCKPPLERITSHFVILPRQNRLFSAYVYLHNIPKGKKIGKHLAYLAYIFNAFFSFWGDLGALVGALVVLFLWVTGHHLGTYPRWYRNAPER